MTTITTEVPGNLLPTVADDPEARDRERQRLKEEFHRLVIHFHEELQRAGLASMSRPGRVDVLIQEKDSGRLLVVEAKTFQERIEPDDFRGLDVAGVPHLLSSDEAEGQYQALGRSKGPLAAEDVQRDARQYWNGSGAVGARWLIARLRSETHEERLHWAASTLAGLGDVSLGPILETLRGDAPPDQALALLRALGWMGGRQTRADPLAELVLVKHLLHEDPDVREAASKALRVLPRERARTWLTRRLRDETDGEVRRTIEEELEPIQAAHG
jgi:hypothetical protein